MSSFKSKMTMIEEKLESSDDDACEKNKQSGAKVRFDEATSTKIRSIYVAVEGNLTGTDSFVFGLNEEDTEKVVEIYPREPEIVSNGLCIKGYVVDVVNFLHRLGYLVVDIAGNSTKTWTMKTNMDHKNHKTCSCTQSSSCAQTLDEMEFERGIWSAARNGEMERLIKLARRGVDAVDGSGYTALHYAARSGHTEICRELLLLGAAINVRTRAGKATPLHRAATAGHLDIVKLLLQAGADVSLKDADGLTPIHRAAAAGHKEVLDLLLKFDRSGASHSRDHQAPVEVKKSALSAENADLIGLLR